MVRRLWITLFSCVFILSVPFGGAAAQNAAPQADAPVLVQSGTPISPPLAPSNLSDKLTYVLQQVAGSPGLLQSSDQSVAAALSLPAHGPGSLMQDAHGRILVRIRASDTSAATLAAVTAAGAQVVAVSAQYNEINATVAPADLEAVAEVGAVANVMEELTPMLADRLNGHQTTTTQAGLSVPSAVFQCPSGTAVSEGDAQLNADLARAAFGVDGTGVKVGILSDSFNAATSVTTHTAEDVASGNLPGAANPCGFTTPVHIVSETVSSVNVIDEGRAMAQIVHDLAPGAQLGFASAHNGETNFANNIRALRTWGADVIADDVFYFDEPMFQDGPVAVAIHDVTAAGAVYMTSAGNDNITAGGHQISSFETPAYRPSAVPAYFGPGFHLESCEDFNPGAPTDPTFGITIADGGGTFLFLNWAQPWFGVTTDLDIYVTNAANTLLVAHANHINTGGAGTQEPFEFVGWGNSSGSTQTYHVHVCRRTNTGGDTLNPRFKWVLAESQGVLGVEYPVSNLGDIVGPDIFGHSADLSAISVAAAPYFDSNNPESFSSPGPAVHYFGPVIGSVPASAVPPVTINQPDFTATDGGCTTFFHQFDAISNCWRFFGTSAAAPHAAAVAALMKQTSIMTPTVPISQGSVRGLLAITAAHMSGGTVPTTGAGLVDALAAITKQLAMTVRLFLPTLLR